MAKFVAKSLSEWAVSLQAKDIPEQVLLKAEDCMLDAIACAIPGSKTDGALRVKTVALGSYGTGRSPIWFSDQTLNSTGAAFANSAAASMLDMDDGFRQITGHPGSAIIPAVLASFGPDATGAEVLTAIVAAYELTVRVGVSENRRAYHTGNYTGIGAATSVALANGLTSEQLTHAIATSVYHGPRVADLTLSNNMGGNVKESIPWSVVTGMSAANLAEQGFTGCRDALDIDERYTTGAALEGLDHGYFQTSDVNLTVSHAILRTYFKKYACCRWCHSAIEAFINIINENELSVDEIDDVKVETFKQAAQLNNYADPETLESAQYSVVYCMAIAAIRGETVLSPLTRDDLHDDKAVALARNIAVEWDPEMDQLFSTHNPTKVIVSARGQKFDCYVKAPWGDPTNPTSRAELVGKFKSLAQGNMAEEQADNIINAVHNIRNGGLGPLLKALVG